MEQSQWDIGRDNLERDKDITAYCHGLIDDLGQYFFTKCRWEEDEIKLQSIIVSIFGQLK